MIRGRIVENADKPWRRNTVSHPLTWDVSPLQALRSGQAAVYQIAPDESHNLRLKIINWASRREIQIATRYNRTEQELWVWRTS